MITKSLEKNSIVVFDNDNKFIGFFRECYVYQNSEKYVKNSDINNIGLSIIYYLEANVEAMSYFTKSGESCQYSLSGFTSYFIENYKSKYFFPANKDNQEFIDGIKKLCRFIFVEFKLNCGRRFDTSYSIKYDDKNDDYTITYTNKN